MSVAQHWQREEKNLGVEEVASRPDLGPLHTSVHTSHENGQEEEGGQQWPGGEEAEDDEGTFADREMEIQRK